MRIGIIGCGLIGAKRAAAAASHEIVFVCDRDASRAAVLAQRTGGKAITEWQHAVQADVDIIVVATTHDQLAMIALAAVRAGKHVLVEKPAGRSLVELQPIASAAAQNRLVVKVGFNHRFHPGFQKAKELIDQGALGELMFIRGRYGHGGRKGMETEWRCIREISGGGEAIDQGSHLIDLSRWFLGELSVDYAAAPTLFWKLDVEDNCFLALRTKAGAIAWLHAGWTEWKNIFSFEISGRDGKLAVDGLGGSYGTERLTYYKMLPEMGPPETVSWEYPFADSSWALEFDNFVDAISTGQRPCGDIHDALANMAILEAIYRKHQ